MTQGLDSNLTGKHSTKWLGRKSENSNVIRQGEEDKGSNRVRKAG